MPRSSPSVPARSAAPSGTASSQGGWSKTDILTLLGVVAALLGIVVSVAIAFDPRAKRVYEEYVLNRDLGVLDASPTDAAVRIPEFNEQIVHYHPIRRIWQAADLEDSPIRIQSIEFVAREDEYSSIAETLNSLIRKKLDEAAIGFYYGNRCAGTGSADAASAPGGESDDPNGTADDAGGVADGGPAGAAGAESTQDQLVVETKVKRNSLGIISLLFDIAIRCDAPGLNVDERRAETINFILPAGMPLERAELNLHNSINMACHGQAYYLTDSGIECIMRKGARAKVPEHEGNLFYDNYAHDASLGLRSRLAVLPRLPAAPPAPPTNAAKPISGPQ